MVDHERIARAFDLGEPLRVPVLAARGANGFVWRLETDRAVYAVKELQPWVADEERPFDVDVQTAALAAGVPMPALVLTTDGRAMVDRVRVYEWVDLDAPWEPPVDRDVAREVGKILGAIHSLDVTSPEVLQAWFTVPPTLDEWRDLVGRATDADVSWSDSLEREIDFLADVGASLEPPQGPLITCHRDFVPSNVVPSRGQPVVLDWENAGPMTADAELAWSLLWWISDDHHTDLDAAVAFVEGYGHAPTLDRSSFTPVLVTHLNYLRVSAQNVVNGGELAEFAAGAVERLWPDRLRLRLAAIDELLGVLGS